MVNNPTVSEIVAAYDLARLLWGKYHKLLPSNIRADGNKAYDYFSLSLQWRNDCPQQAMHDLGAMPKSSFRSGWDRCYHEAYGCPY